MNRIRKIIAILTLLPLFLTACVREYWPEAGNGDVILSFSAATPDDVVFSTKSTLGLKSESVIFNMYVFVFDGQNKIFGQYYDYSNKHHSEESHEGNWWWVNNNTTEGVTNGQLRMKLPANDGAANKTVVAIANIDAEMVNISTADLALVDNLTTLDALTAKLKQQITSRSGYFPMVGILRNIQIVGSAPIAITLDRLDAKIQFNVQVAPGSGITNFTPKKWRVVNLPLSAFVVERTSGEKIDHSDNGDPSSPGYKNDYFFDWGDANFETETQTYKGRLHFELVLNGGTKNVTVTETTADLLEGNGNVTKKWVSFGDQKIAMAAKTGATNTWEAVVDYDATLGFLLWDNITKYGGNNALLTFGEAYTINSSTAANILIMASRPTYGFSFYMLESRKSPATKQSWTYADREKQAKDANTGANGDFLYAPKYAPYVELTGELEIAGYGANPAKPTPLTAEVKYLIHLGNFGSEASPNYSNFSIERNHTYTYNIYIHGIENIKAEVTDKNNTDSDPEIEPGATGDITISQEHSIICDSHYSSHIIEIHKDNINAEKITWQVRTPFSEGGPEDNDNIADGTGYDCQWVEFRLNAKSNNEYSRNRMQYLKHTEGDITDPATQSMSIPQFVQFLKDAKNDTNGYGSYFDKNNCITATVFVDEYYYEKHPIDGSTPADFWKQFVNQPMRTLDIIYSGTSKSEDGESSVTGSTFSIQQYSIQTVYDVNNPDVHQAWGFEYFYDEGEKEEENWDYYPGSKSRNNNFANNGLRNTMVEWELTNTSSNRFNTTSKKHWSTFIDETTEDGHSILRPYVSDSDKGYRYPRYSCMSRNRDINGNDDIDANEVRWYTASYNQLICLFLGANGFDRTARLYQRSAVDQASSDHTKWRQHYLASDRKGTSDTDPKIVWAEEGMNGSGRSWDAGSGDFGKAKGKYTVRCLRNLGNYTDETVEPEPLISVRRFLRDDQGNETEWTTNTTYQGANEIFYFDCSRINANSLRYFTNQELILHNENDEASNLYMYFETAPANMHPKLDNDLYTAKKLPSGKNYQHINVMNWYLDQDEQPNPFCPEGYRLPNVREATVVQKFAPETEGGLITKNPRAFMFTRTQWSLRAKVAGTWGWIGSHEKMMMGNENGAGDQSTSYARCVKDDKTPRP